MVYITSRRHVERTQAVTDIKVYSSCPTATLRVNGGAAVPGTADGMHVVRWPGLSLRPGDNPIVADASCGGRTVTEHGPLGIERNLMSRVIGRLVLVTVAAAIAATGSAGAQQPVRYRDVVFEHAGARRGRGLQDRSVEHRRRW